MSNTRINAKRYLDTVNQHIDHALTQLKSFEAMGYGNREAFKKAIVEVATGLIMLQEAVSDIKEWI